MGERRHPSQKSDGVLAERHASVLLAQSDEVSCLVVNSRAA